MCKAPPAACLSCCEHTYRHTPPGPCSGACPPQGPADQPLTANDTCGICLQDVPSAQFYVIGQLLVILEASRAGLLQRSGAGLPSWPPRRHAPVQCRHLPAPLLPGLPAPPRADGDQEQGASRAVPTGGLRRRHLLPRVRAAAGRLRRGCGHVQAGETTRGRRSSTVCLGVRACDCCHHQRSSRPPLPCAGRAEPHAVRCGAGGGGGQHP